jgi:hypothetical protein
LLLPTRSLANARDVGEWLGASGHATFNFAPGVRPVPLEIHMHGLDIHNFEARMQAMMRPCYSAILTHAGADKPAIVFVPTRKHVRLTALDLLTSAAADGNQYRWVGCDGCRRCFLCSSRLVFPAGCSWHLCCIALSMVYVLVCSLLPAAFADWLLPCLVLGPLHPLLPSSPLRFRLAGEKDLEPYVAQVKDAALAHALSFGVGYIHETQPARERQVVEYLFDAGAIQVRMLAGCWWWAALGGGGEQAFMQGCFMACVNRALCGDLT